MTDLTEIVDHRTKGIPGGTPPFDLATIGAKGWNVLRGDLPLPLAILSEDVLADNGGWMRRFCQRAEVSLAPHGKTTMAPKLFRRQLQDGAWAITLSTSHQVQVARDFGVSRILLANQIADPAFLDSIAREIVRDPAFDFYCLVDSVEGVRLLDSWLRARHPGCVLQVLVEIGATGGRTGARGLAAALSVAEAVAQRPETLALRGVECFEGIFAGAAEARLRQVDALLADMTQALAAIDAAGLFAPGEVIASAGGSAYFDRVTEHLGAVRLSAPHRIVLRSGCYIAHDAKMYRDFLAELEARSPAAQAVDGKLQPALQIVCAVQSRPEPQLVLLSAGKRDLSYDAHLPMPALFARRGDALGPQPIGDGHSVFALADQHAFMRVPAQSPLAVGDMVFLDISHPCTTFDKWRLLYGVDKDYRVVTGYRTYF